MHQLKTKFSSWYILAVLVVLQPPRGLEAHLENLVFKNAFPARSYFVPPGCHPGLRSGITFYL